VLATYIHTYIYIYIGSTVNEANVGSSLKTMDATGKKKKKKTLRLPIVAKDLQYFCFALTKKIYISYRDLQGYLDSLLMVNGT